MVAGIVFAVTALATLAITWTAHRYSTPAYREPEPVAKATGIHHGAGSGEVPGAPIGDFSVSMLMVVDVAAIGTDAWYTLCLFVANFVLSLTECNRGR